jgi:GABA(A) receptor-associated protein
MVQHPTRVPCWIDKAEGDKSLPEVVDGRKKYLIEKDMTVGQVMYVIRKRVNITEKMAIFLFIDGNVLPTSTQTAGELYKQYKRNDGLLYLTYRAESTFG